MENHNCRTVDRLIVMFNCGFLCWPNRQWTWNIQLNCFHCFSFCLYLLPLLTRKPSIFSCKRLHPQHDQKMYSWVEGGNYSLNIIKLEKYKVSSDNSQLTWDMLAIFVMFAKEVEKRNTILNNLNTGLLLSSFLNIRFYSWIFIKNSFFVVVIYKFFFLEIIAYGWNKVMNWNNKLQS